MPALLAQQEVDYAMHVTWTLDLGCSSLDFKPGSQKDNWHLLALHFHRA